MQRGREDRDACGGACAACKHQRKKCGRGCVLAPFFPAGVYEEYSCFREVHRLFGVSNVQKLITRLRREKGATEAQLEEAIDAIKWVARSWNRDPLRGCRGEYKRLEETYWRLRSVIAQCGFCEQSTTTALELEQQQPDCPNIHHRLHYNPTPIHRHRNILLSSDGGDDDANMVSDCFFNGADGIHNVSGAPVSYVPGILEAQIGFGPGCHLPPLETQLITSTQFGLTVASNTIRRLQGCTWRKNYMDHQRDHNRSEREGSSDRSPACASCKHQRKKCGKDCTMAPFFPAEKDSSFKEVHRLFGVRNVQKMIVGLKEENATEAQVAEAVDAIKWVASWWERDPVRGCYGEYKRLEEQCLRLQRQVSQCGFCTTQNHQTTTLPMPQPPIPAPQPPAHFNWGHIANGTHVNNQYHQHHARLIPSYNNPGINISGYLDGGGVRNLNEPHPNYLPLLDATQVVEADHHHPGSYASQSLDKQGVSVFPPASLGFRLPRTAINASSPPLATSATNYYHHLQDQGRNCVMEMKKTKEDDTNWEGSNL